MTKEKQNKDKLSVDSLANGIKKMQKSTHTTSFFKSILFRKLKSIKSGELTVIDGGNRHVFGSPDSKFKAELEVFSQEFYVFWGVAVLTVQRKHLQLDTGALKTLSS